MKYKILLKKCCLYFSCWSKKGYSIFVGLGREVHISRLALHMYKSVLLKSTGNGVIVNTDHAADWEMMLLDPVYMWKIMGISLKGEVYPVVFNRIKE